MKLSLSYSLIDGEGKELSQGEALVEVNEENFSLRPKFGEPLLFALRDIIDISERDYKISLFLSSKEKLILFNLGYQYEDFLRVLFKLRNEMLLKDLLMQETLKKSGVEAEFAYYDGEKKQEGSCESRLYETAIVILPERGEIVRIPYSDILEVKEENYSVIITTEFEAKLSLSKMGENLDPFKEALSKLINDLSLKSQLYLKELFPTENPVVIRKAARFLKEGRAAKRKDIESISPKLWAGLEKKLEPIGIKEEYDFLLPLAQKEKICIGLKRGLMGELTGEYIWFLIPVYSTDSSVPGNAIAMEAGSQEQSGKATYFFRIVSRKDYPNFKEIDDLHKLVDNFIRQIDRAMTEINFRREPIYLPEERLAEPKYLKYKISIEKIPALKTLRSHFIGRVIHSSPEQWKGDVMDLLKFNVSETDDDKKWEKEEQKEEQTEEQTEV